MKIAIYTRKSIETDKGSSIENQIQICKDYFLRQGEKCSFEIFQDEGFTGGNTDRPAFKRMMELVKANKIDIVAVYKLDRMSRNIIDFYKIYEIFEKNNVGFVSVTEQFDATNQIGKMMMHLLAGFADMERANIKQRVKDNMKLLGQKGKWSGGNAPVGYEAYRIEEGGKKASYLKIKDSEVDIIKDIYTLYLEGVSTRKIADTINLTYNLKTSQRRIGNILYSPIYVKSSEATDLWLKNSGYEVHGVADGKGYLTYGKSYIDKRGMKVKNNEYKTIAATSKHDGIIESSVWLKVQEMLKEKTIDPKPRISQKTFLAHMVKCSKCSSNMQVWQGHKRKDGTRLLIFRAFCDCGTSQVSAEKIENDVLKFIKVMSNKKKLEAYLSIDNKKDNYEKDILKINKTIIEKDKVINGLTEKLALVSPEVMDVLLNKIETTVLEKKELNEKLFEIEKKKLLDKSSVANIDLVHTAINDFLINFEKFNIEEKQIKVKHILKAVTWDSVEKEVGYKLLS